MHYTRDNRHILLLMALWVAIWGVLGWRDLDLAAQLGFNTDGRNTVIRVYPGSRAEQAGFQPGDRILKINDSDANDAARLAREPRPKPGQGATYRIEREGQEQLIFARYGPLTERTRSLAHASTIIGFCFLLFPTFAYFSRRSRPTQVLAMVGIGLGLAFMRGPWIQAWDIRAVVDSIENLFVFFGLAAMLHFLLIFPNGGSFIEKTVARKLLYLPAFGLWLLISYRIFFTPPLDSVLSKVTGLVTGLTIAVYLLLSLFRVLRNYSRTTRPVRKSLALNLMLWGTVIGLLPITVAQLVSTAAPQTVLPGQDFYFVTLALIPMSWAYSASRHAAGSGKPE